MSGGNKIPKGWVETTLDDVTSILGDGLHGTPKYAESGEYYFINGSNLNDGKIEITEKTKQCTQDEYEKYKKDLNNRTILVSINGSLGYFAYYNNEKCILGKSACYFNVKESISKHFIGFQIRTKYFQKYIDRLAGGTTIKNVSLKTMREFPFVIPNNINEQQAIASILTTFDDKIELLQAQNQTLEATAQTIFKEWFGKYQIGDELPEGWRVGKLGDEFDILMGQSPKGTSYNTEGNGSIFFQGRAEFTERFPDIRLFTTEPKRMADKFDVLVSVRAPVGDINVALDKCCIGRGLAAVNSIYKSYCLYKLKSLKPVFDLFESEGTVFGSINKASFSNIEVVIPIEAYKKELDDLLFNLDLKIYNNYLQIQTLQQTRDTLLPKLMSGKLRVDEFKD